MRNVSIVTSSVNLFLRARGIMRAMDEDLIRRLPKAEMHIHLEGSFEPELMFALADRNRVPLLYTSVDEVRRAYQFTDLQSFLNLYYAAAQALVPEQAFYDPPSAYLHPPHPPTATPLDPFS